MPDHVSLVKRYFYKLRKFLVFLVYMDGQNHKCGHGKKDKRQGDDFEDAHDCAPYRLYALRLARDARTASPFSHWFRSASVSCRASSSS